MHRMCIQFGTPPEHRNLVLHLPHGAAVPLTAGEQPIGRSRPTITDSSDLPSKIRCPTASLISYDEQNPTPCGIFNRQIPFGSSSSLADPASDHGHRHHSHLVSSNERSITDPT
ncbi:hypothetical protein ACLOJK_036435 [Asimina triloba]